MPFFNAKIDAGGLYRCRETTKPASCSYVDIPYEGSRPVLYAQIWADTRSDALKAARKLRHGAFYRRVMG